MSQQREHKVGTLITILNSISVGELSSITSKLSGVREQLLGLQQAELADNLSAASSAIERGDAAEFRRLVAHTVSRLGHLRGQV